MPQLLSLVPALHALEGVQLCADGNSPYGVLLPDQVADNGMGDLQKGDEARLLPAGASACVRFAAELSLLSEPTCSLQGGLICREGVEEGVAAPADATHPRLSCYTC